MSSIEQIIDQTAAEYAAGQRALQVEYNLNGHTEHAEVMAVKLDWYLADQMLKLIKEREASND